MQRIGIIGAGQMGSGIAHVCAVAGLDVRMLDVQPDQLEKSLNGIRANMMRQVSRGKIPEEQVTAALARVSTGTDYAELADCDLVIEAATENEDIKREIFKTLVPHLDNHTLLATNTSSISITRLAANTDRPEKFMGMHFMNPVPI